MKIEEIRKKIQKKQKELKYHFRLWSKWSGKFLVGMSLFTVFSVVFFWFSPEIFRQDPGLLDSGIGEESIQKLGELETEIVYRKANEEGDYVELILQVKGSTLVTDIDYEVASGESVQGKQVDAELTYLYGDYYLIQLENVPENWKQLQVAFGYEVVISEEPEIVSVQYDLARNQTDDSKEVQPLSKTGYAILLSTIEEEMNQMLIEKAEERILERLKKMESIHKKIIQNEDDMKFQNAQQYEATQKANDTLKNQKVSLEEENIDDKELIQQYQEQIEKSKERREELQGSEE